MKMKSIKDVNLAEILPENISADKNLKAVAESLDCELKRLTQELRQVLHLPRLNELNHEVLNHFGYQFHCDHFEPESMNLEVKRNLIRQSLYWHKIKGTPASVEEFLGYFGIGAQVIENWEYGGEPYFFRLKLKDVAYLMDDGDTFIRLIYAAKNERSWIDAFIFDLSPEQDTEIYVGTINQEVGLESVDLAGLQAEKLHVDLRIFNQSAGNEFIQYDSLLNEKNLLHTGIFIQEREYLHVAAQIDEPIYIPDPTYIPEIDEPEPLGDFLRLYFLFPHSRIKTLTLTNPQEDLSGRVINAVGNYIVNKRALIDTYGNAPLRISKAMYVRREKIKIWGDEDD